MFSVNLQNSRERLNEAGDLPKWVVEQSRLGALSKIYQHLAGANFEPEGEMRVGRLPWHRRDPDGPRQKGDGCVHSISHRGPTATQRLELQLLPLSAGLSKFLHQFHA